MGGNRIVCNRTKKAEGRCQICTCLLPYYKIIRFPHITKGHGQNIVHSLLCTDNHGKKEQSNRRQPTLLLQSITQFPDEITKAHKIRHTLYNVSSV